MNQKIKQKLTLPGILNLRVKLSEDLLKLKIDTFLLLLGYKEDMTIEEAMHVSLVYKVLTEHNTQAYAELMDLAYVKNIDMKGTNAGSFTFNVISNTQLDLIEEP